MDTGIYYLYEYNNNHKLRNTGFLKITQKEHSYLLQLNVRGLPVTLHDTAKLSAFYMENDSANATHLSDITCGNHIISEKVTITESHFPNQYTLNQMDGFFLMLPRKELLAATAPNIEFDAGKIIFLSDKIYATPQQGDPLSDDIHPESPEPEITAVSEPEEISPDEPEVEITAALQPEENLSQKISSEENLPQKKKRTIRKIRRCELSCLPRRYWNLANNSFLLHGYYNYNHLLLVEEDGHYWLGVPGIYDPKESRAAELFGFTQFSDSYNQQLALTEEECNDFGRFGYWCRYLK